MDNKKLQEFCVLYNARGYILRIRIRAADNPAWSRKPESRSSKDHLIKMVEIINPGSEGSKYRIALVTCENNPIKNERRPKERSIQQLREAAKWFCAAHTSLKVRSLSWDYNCMGLVFASRRTGIDIDDSLNQILKEDGYKKIQLKDVQPGDVVIYLDKFKKPAHVGIVLEHRSRIVEPPPTRPSQSWHTVVLSQWGWDGEYIHDLLDVQPQWQSEEPEFWSEKKI
jgi:hypothetical protein